MAAGIGSEDTVELLLDESAKPDHSDKNNRTPLSWAAENGSLRVVGKLLLAMKEKKQAVNLESNDKGWTPLWYASHGGHVDVTKVLLKNGAKPSARNNRDESLIEYLDKLETSPSYDGSNINTHARSDIRKILEPYFPQFASSPAKSDELNESFLAMVLPFPKSHGEELKHRQQTVRELLSSEGDIAGSNDNNCLNWVHLPANNVSHTFRRQASLANNRLKMRWVEVSSIINPNAMIVLTNVRC